MASVVFLCASWSAAGAAEIERAEAYHVAATKTFFALSVGDIKTMKDWYARMLDMAVLAEGERPAPNGSYAMLKGDGILIEMQMRQDAVDSHTYSDGLKETWKLHGAFKVGVFVTDIEAAESAMKERGVGFVHGIVTTSQPLSLRTFSIVDPEGNMVQFFGE
ncbi:MAG: VOC family protein [Parvularculaceae bacterium]